jgi:dCMP deaminase
MPCFDCSKLIIQAGIVEVHYCEDYRDTSGVDLLTKAGITVYQDVVWNNE